MTEQGMTKRSYLTVFAALVLAVALAVPAIGAGGGDNDAQKIAEKALKKAKKANKKAKQALEQSGEPGPRGPAGADGQDGEDGSARAFATINHGGTGGSAGPGTVVAGRSTPGTTVSRPGVGVYCVTFPGISSVNSAAVASATNTLTDSMVTAEVLRNTPLCSDSAFEVVTKKENEGASGYAAPDNFVAFTILVP